MSQQGWDASDEVGRIKVKISEGYVTSQAGIAEFVKMLDHVHFNFQAVPLGKMFHTAILCSSSVLIKVRCVTASRNCLAKRSIAQKNGTDFGRYLTKSYGPPARIK
jgi:hypothetical protein